MDLNNINSNILIHAGGKCASHRLMDLLILNNANLTVQVPGKNIPFFEPNYVEHWKLDPNERTKDLNSINQQGKYWLLKTGGVPLYVYHMENIFDNITEIGLVRENISDSVASYLLAFFK